MVIASLYPCPFDLQFRHDFSASIYKSGKIFAYEENKINSLKNDGNLKFAERSFFSGCRELGIEPTDIDYWILPKTSKNFRIHNLYLFFSFFLKVYRGKEKDFLIWSKKKIRFISHHDSHVGLSAFSSGYNDCAFLSIDGGGDFGDKRNTYWGEYKGKRFVKHGELHGTDNISNFHAFITDFCCFGVDNGKVNGLASYGKVNLDLYKNLSNLLSLSKNGISFNRKRFRFSNFNLSKYKFDQYESYKILNQQPSYTNVLKICSGYLLEDVAATAEQVIKDIICNFLVNIRNKTKSKNLVVSGGLFMNVGLNGYISEKKIFEKIFFPVAPSDIGLSLGAILFFLKIHKKNIKVYKYGLNPFLGPSFSQSECLDILDKFRLDYKVKKNHAKAAAKNISKGKIVGIFYGRAEFGQRSLGARSILADPRRITSKQKLNLHLKRRDWFMPFAPSVLQEDYEEWFGDSQKSYYMQLANKIIDKNKIQKIPAAVHVDGTCRVQLVDKNINKNYWNIINNFKKITGVPLLLNTSFNRHGISTISSPRQAIEHLLEGCVDVLYLEGIEIKLYENRKIIKKKSLFTNENYLLMNTNINWLKSNRQYLSNRQIIKFKSELKKKFKKKN
jgi:carbamoyltransferase